MLNIKVCSPPKLHAAWAEITTQSATKFYQRTNNEPDFLLKMKKMRFSPPIEERETMELIGMANCTNDSWQYEAIELAKLELEKRNISREYQDEVITKWNAEIEEFERQQEKIFIENELKEYSLLQMLIIFFLAPLILIGKVDYEMSVTDLKKENYKRKVVQRKISLIAGATAFIIVFYILMKY